jgi:undecaprenyl-diphosphatase
MFRAILLGIVEGVTEFLPISSTGHLLLCEKWMKIDLDEGFWKMFTIFIQIGAIFAVVVYFRERILALLRGVRGKTGRLTPLEASGHAATASSSGISPILLTLLATIPALVVGKLAHHWVETYMEDPKRVGFVVAMALGIGGIIIALIELVRPAVRTHTLEQISFTQGMIIGCTQVLAILFPGTSRSAATIMPGLVLGLSREAATEFSFFLAIPAMFAACGYSLLKHRSHLTGEQWMLLAVGTLVSFLVAWVVIAGFMSFIRKRSFMPFAVYRIALSAFVLWVMR